MKSRNILVITTWSYKEGLIQSSTLPYLKIIHGASPSSKIFLVTEEKEEWEKDELKAVKVKLQEDSIYWVPQHYIRFGIKKIISSIFQFIKLIYIILANKVASIHCFCTPAGGTGYVLSMFTSRELILDSYEPHAESMVENGTWKKEGIAFKILWWLEKQQSKRAKYCIAAARGMKDYAREKYGVKIKNFYVRPTCVDTSKFYYKKDVSLKIRTELGLENKIVIVYAGKFGGIYLDEEVFDFFKVAYNCWGDQLRVLLLTPTSKDEIFSLCKQCNVPKEIFVIIKAAHEQMPDYLSVADVAITPVKPVPSKRYCSPIKNGEYWAIGLPIIITKNISDDSGIIEQNKIGVVLEELKNESYLNAVKEIEYLLNCMHEKDLRTNIVQIAKIYRGYEIAKSVYTDIYSCNK